MQHNEAAGPREMKSLLVATPAAVVAGSQNHSHTLSNDFTLFRLKAPIVATAGPQAISSMGFPVTSAIHHAVAASFKVEGQGWDGDTRNPDEPSKREARIKHVLDCALRESQGLDLMSLDTDRSQSRIAPVAVMPDIAAFIRSDEKIVAVLNCAEVLGAPDSPNLYSKGFVQAAIVERSDSKGATRRLIIFSLSGNLVCVVNEKMGQKFDNSKTTETECCCFTKMQGYDVRGGSADFNYRVDCQSNCEITLLNIENAVVHVQVTKKKLDSIQAQNNPPVPVVSMVLFSRQPEDCCGCGKCECGSCCDGTCKCPALSCFDFCSCCDACSSKQVTSSGGSRNVQYNNTISRMFGYTSILNIGGVPKPVISARDAENGAFSDYFNSTS